jgi:hypothetical protein
MARRQEPVHRLLAGACLSQFAQHQRARRRHPIDQPIGPLGNPNITKSHPLPPALKVIGFESDS